MSKDINLLFERFRRPKYWNKGVRKCMGMIIAILWTTEQYFLFNNRSLFSFIRQFSFIYNFDWWVLLTELASNLNLRNRKIFFNKWENISLKQNCHSVEVIRLKHLKHSMTQIFKTYHLCILIYLFVLKRIDKVRIPKNKKRAWKHHSFRNCYTIIDIIVDIS